MYKEKIERHGASKRTGYKVFGEGDNLIGIELELDKFEVENQDEFKEQLAQVLFTSPYKNHYFVERDGSLRNGMEVVTQPHSIDEMRKFLNEGLKEILHQLVKVGAEDFSKFAGIHFHISRALFGKNHEEQCEPIWKLWYFMSQNDDIFLKIGRRTNRMTCRFPKPKMSITSAKEKTKKEIHPLTRGVTKYQAINLKHSTTVEFRTFQTTTNIELLTIWTELIWHLANKSTTISEEDVNKWDVWFNGAPQLVLDYVNQYREVK